ncbi:MAG: hypothetical protein ACC652_09035 [Acidimicrobiales bacterium]
MPFVALLFMVKSRELTPKAPWASDIEYNSEDTLRLPVVRAYRNTDLAVLGARAVARGRSVRVSPGMSFGARRSQLVPLFGCFLNTGFLELVRLTWGSA